MDSQTTYDLLKEVREDVRWMRDRVVEHDMQLDDKSPISLPMRLSKVEETLEDIQRLKWRITGFCAGIIAFIEGFHVGIEKLLEHWK